MFPISPKIGEENLNTDEKWSLKRQEDLLEILHYHQPGKNPSFYRSGLWDAIFEHVNNLHKTLPPVSFHDIEMELDRLTKRAKEKKKRKEPLDFIDTKILENQINIKGLTDQQRAEPYATTMARIMESHRQFFEAINGHHKKRNPSDTFAKKASSSTTTKNSFISADTVEGSSAPTAKKSPNQFTENLNSFTAEISTIRPHSPDENIASTKLPAKKGMIEVVNLTREHTPPPEEPPTLSPLPVLEIKHSTHQGMPDVGVLDFRKVVGTHLKRHHEHDNDGIMKRFRLPGLDELPDLHEHSGNDDQTSSTEKQ